MVSALWAWGYNDETALGINEYYTEIRSSPVQVVGNLQNWAKVSAGSINEGCAAIKTDGTLWVWGSNADGQLGINFAGYQIIRKSSPVQTITYATNWSSVSGGSRFFAATKTDGTLWTWGSNYYGKLGDNSTEHRSSPVQTIAYGNDWSVISCGPFHMGAIKTDGTLWLWGRNGGVLGDNSSTNRSSPVQTITGGTNWSKVSCGEEHTAAIKKDGTLWLWGSNNSGQLGNNTTVGTSSPIQTLAYGNNWSQVSCGPYYTAAVKSDGTLWLWGYNSYGELGDSTNTNKSSPVQTAAYGNNWSYVSLGSNSAIATKSDGTLWVWGNNPFGGLGDNTTIPKSSPVQTLGTNKYWVVNEDQISASVYRSFAISSGPPLFIATTPAVIYNGSKFVVQPVIQILDVNNQIYTPATDAITVTVTSGSASLSGTTTVNAISGIATFTDLILTGSGPVTLEFSATGFVSSSVSVYVETAGAIIPKRSETSSSVPTSGQLRLGEFAINIPDRKGFVKKADGSIETVFHSLASGSITASGLVAAGGSNNQVQYNLSGTIAGASSLSYNLSGTYVTVDGTNGVSVPLAIKKGVVQSANVLEVQSSTGTKMHYMNASGTIYGAAIDGGSY